MIFVGGIPFTTDPSSSQDCDALLVLMEHPILVSASESFNAISERKFSVFEESNLEKSTSKCVYVFQREYATVDPTLVDLVGTDEATTCVGLVIRNRRSGMTSVAHMDSSNVVDIGLTQMLSLVVDHNFDDVFDVHVVGAFEDASSQVWPKSLYFYFRFSRDVTCYHSGRNINVESNGLCVQSVNRGIKSRNRTKLDDYSFSLCTKIIETLRKSNVNFHIQTLHVLGHNTRWDSQGNAFPIFNGFLVEPSTGSVVPASFDITSRCPDEIVRRIRLTASFEDPSCTGRLLETYDTQTDQFVIAPFTWTRRQLSVAFTLRHLSDTEILLTYSTSPSAEGPDFVDNQRRQCEYLIEHPDWRKTFPSKQPHVFERTSGGGWRRH